MPRPDRARAELAAIRRAAPSPERHVIEGTVWVTDPGCGACGDAIDVAEEQYTDDRYSRTLQRLAGKRVRIVIEVLPPEGDADAP